MVMAASSRFTFETCTLCRRDGATANTGADAPDKQDSVRRLAGYLWVRQGHVLLFEESSRCSRDGQRQDGALRIADVARQLADELRGRRAAYWNELFLGLPVPMPSRVAHMQSPILKFVTAEPTAAISPSASVPRMCGRS
jgi:hypothetical protein